MVPFERNHCFSSRESELNQLRQSLFSRHNTAKIALTGLGGIGKTQLALELVYQIRIESKDCSVIWIPATNKESLEQAYLNAAKLLGIPGYEDDNADVRTLVRDYLSNESTGQWLLVFDNADDISIWVDKPTPESSRLLDCLPRSCYGSIIFTTRDRKVAVKLSPQNVLEVSEMDETGSKQLLGKYLTDQDLLESQGEATALLDGLSHLPLAIVQAAAYINANDIGLGDYLSLLEEQEEEVIELLGEDFESEGRYHDIKNPVATTWFISFQQVQQRDPLALDYLSFMACVEAKDIPLSLLPPGQSRRKEIEAIGTLQAYSFIVKRPTVLTVNIHRLVHLATRNWLRKEGMLYGWSTRVIAKLKEVMIDIGHSNRATWRPLLPHVYFALGSTLVDKDDKNRVRVLWRYGKCMYCDGRYWEAEEAFKQVLEVRKTKLGADHLDTLSSMRKLASTYRRQGRWSEAEKLGVQVMETSKTKLGADHPDTLTSIANLASTYRNQGRWEEAEKLDVQVMETRKTKLGADHPSTLTSIANLASTFWNQGRWEEAEKLFVQVMETRKTKLGADHPDTLTSMANLASTYRNQGRWDEAEELQAKELELCARKLGQRHPDTLISMMNLAFIWKDIGRQEDALDLIQTCFDLRQQVLGIGHPYTVSTLSTLDAWREESK